MTVQFLNTREAPRLRGLPIVAEPAAGFPVGQNWIGGAGSPGTADAFLLPQRGTETRDRSARGRSVSPSIARSTISSSRIWSPPRAGSAWAIPSQPRRPWA